MLAKVTLAVAGIASAAAFAPTGFSPALRQGSATQMSMAMDRREVMQGAALAGIALVNAGAANAACDNAAKKCTSEETNKDSAPIITIFDHRGCAEHSNKEYSGPKSSDYNDEMLVKVQSKTLKRDDPKYTDMAKRVRLESLGPIKNTWQRGWGFDSDLNSGISTVHGNEKAAKGSGVF
mmetsp:Transcript_49541/g.101132  ORF Transcript_49541/g.101132 Transcript_49541/m.101132 type:complete len:179 (-) Transcript_49541:147-683(-)